MATHSLSLPTTHWRALLLLCLVAHALYALSLVGVYFSPTPHLEATHDSLTFADHAPAKRVVVFVADDWQAEAFFARRGRRDMPFLRDIVEHRGSWGVVHTPPPSTEQAQAWPRHAHLLGGTAATATTMAAFESILNTSHQSWILGSPQLMVGGTHPQTAARTRPPPTKAAATTAATSTSKVARKPKPQSTTKSTASLWTSFVDTIRRVALGARRPKAVPRLHRRTMRHNTTGNASAVLLNENVVNLGPVPPFPDLVTFDSTKTPSITTPSSLGHDARARAAPRKHTNQVPASATKIIDDDDDANDSCFAKLHDLLYDAPDALERVGTIFFCPFTIPTTLTAPATRAHVDHLVSVAVDALERFYNHDGATTYVLTASQGTTTIASGPKTDSLRTPLVAWGAGIQHVPRRRPVVADEPAKATKAKAEAAKAKASAPSPPTSFDFEVATPSEAAIRARIDAQEAEEAAAIKQWGLTQYPRKDVLLQDVAALLTALLGVSTPRDSHGVLPTAYLTSTRYRAFASLANARDLLRHATRKLATKQAASLLGFRPSTTFRTELPTLLSQLQAAWQHPDLDVVESLSPVVQTHALAMLETLARPMLGVLPSLLVAACLAWVAVLALALATTSFLTAGLMGSVETWLAIVVVANAAFLALEHAPKTFSLFLTCTLVMGNLVWRFTDHQARLASRDARWCWTVVLALAALLELVVFRWQHRGVFAVLGVIVAMGPIVARHAFTRLLGTLAVLGAIVAYLSSDHGSSDALLVELAGLALVVLMTSLLTRASAISLTPFVLALATSLGIAHATMHYLSLAEAPPLRFLLLTSTLAFVPMMTLVLELTAPQLGASSIPPVSRAYVLQVAVALAPTPLCVVLCFPFEAMLVVGLVGVVIALLENLRLSIMPPTPPRRLSAASLKAAFAYLATRPRVASS